jgi:SOS-response transcriptional repressor LexA
MTTDPEARPDAIQLMTNSSGAGSRRSIPIAAAPDSADTLSLCASGEPFALMVLGDSMEPEFREGDIVIIEPEGLARDGSFVLAESGGTLIFRRLQRQGAGWRLQALQAGHPEIQLADLASVRGVIIQKSRPGRRR